MQENEFFQNQIKEAEENNSSAGFQEKKEPNVQYIQYIPFGFTPKTYLEKKGIRKIANAMSISLFSMILVTSLWSFIYFHIMLNFGFSVENSIKIVSEPAIMQVLQILISSFCFTVPYIIAFKIFGFRISNLISFKKPEKGDFFPLFLIGIAFCSFANIGSSYLSAWLESLGFNYVVDYGENPDGFFGFLLSLISTAIVPALVEEFAYRGLVLGSLRKYGDGFAVLTSSIIFGIMHGNFEQMPFAFLVGLALGFVAVKSSSIWISVAIHAFNNFVSVFFTYFMNGFSGEIQNLIYVIFLISTLLLGIVGIFLLKNKSGEFFNFDASDTEAKEKTKYKWFFSSPLVIIYICIEIFNSFTFFI